MNQFKVSVIIPIYNVEEYLGECLQSVLHQTLQGIQVIMIDDGSLDGSGDIARCYAEKYEHFQYVKQENGGLGNARNNGVRYAKGKYIIFLDSDDVVPEYAYEKMYNAAERTGSDMAVGHVTRFNSKKELLSNLHEIAFRKHLDKTHITENTDLIYDTTSWNKLIRKDFWDQYGFKFPEGILYEDIPVTIPMHYYAKSVTMVHDVCYRWRVRDGANKSITQRTDDFTNLHDRITVLRMVDRFFKEKVTEENLWLEKYFKWLYIDLMIYVNTCLYLDKEDTLKMMKIIKSYIEEEIPLETINRLPVMMREKYKALMDLDIKHLLELRQYETDHLKNLKIVKSGRGYIGKFPENLIPKSEAEMTVVLSQKRLSQTIEDVQVKDGKCIIEGYAILPGIDVSNINQQIMKAYLFQSETGEKLPLELYGRKSKRARKKYRFKIDNETKQFFLRNYGGAGYRIVIDYKKDVLDKELSGEYYILLTYERDNFQKEEFLRGMSVNLRNKIKENSYISNHQQINLIDTFRRELKLQVNQEIAEAIINLEEDGLKIRLLNGENDKILAKKGYNVIALNGTVQDGIHTIPIKEIPMDQRILGIERNYKFIPLTNVKKGRNFSMIKEFQILEEVSKDFQYSIIRRENVPVLEKIEQKDSAFDITIQKYMNKNLKKFSNAMLYVKDPLIGERVILGESKLFQNSDGYTAKFHIDLQNENIIKNLYAAKRQVLIEYYGEETEKQKVYGGKEVFDKRYVARKRRYRFVVDVETDQFLFNTLRLKEYFSRSKKKRDLVNRFIYPLLRKLPLKKKCIVFESMWGKKYSCNPRYLYEYIDEKHPDYECVWILKDECIPIVGNGKRVRRFSLKYLYYMATAKYFVNNVNFHDDYVKREGQIEVQTMHGTPLKTIGLDVPGDFPTKKKENNYIRKCKRWDYLIVQSKFVADLSRTAFRFDKKIMDTGYPRTDVLYEFNNVKKMSEIKAKLGLPENKKIIMYAPTWRVRNKFDLMLDLDKMKQKFSDEYICILRLHHFSAPGWDGIPDNEFVFDLTDYQSIEDLYVVTDILITDYSSVMFDYAVLKRPMLFFTYDLDEYRNKLRGFNIDIETEAPGPLLFTSDEVIDAIEHIDDTVEQSKERVDAFEKKYIPYECAHSSKKVFEIMTGK